MARYDFDLFTLGAGSGGVRASRIAAEHGARVAVAESRYLGGTCVNVGCIPKKLFVYASAFASELREAAGFGWSVDRARFEWPRLLANKNREIERLNGVYARLLDQAGVKRMEGRARLIDPHTVEVEGGARHTAEHVLIAAGGWPSLPDLPGKELGITSNDAFHLRELPRRALIVGGGYIAVEFAGIWQGLGVEVTQIYRGPLFLRGFDDDARRALAEEMRARAIDLRFERNVTCLESAGSGVRAGLDDGSSLEVDQVLFATGRDPQTDELGLQSAGVETDEEGAVKVDDWSRTSVPHIYAVGDVTNRINLTPVAIAEGHAFADTLFGGRPRRMDRRDVPSCIFSQPELGTVGLTEAEARERHAKVDVYLTRFRPLKLTLTDLPERTLIKLVVDRATDRVVGCHMVGPHAGEIIQGLAVALKCGATKTQFDATMGIHPTSAEEFVQLRGRANSD
jgi:glutathione reductase (NADPH)